MALVQSDSILRVFNFNFSSIISPVTIYQKAYFHATFKYQFDHDEVTCASSNYLFTKARTVSWLYLKFHVVTRDCFVERVPE
jgi:hypothetical protein